jgi:tRNA threonylcarbamoyladenosine biosynthesis protein TsaE
MLGRSFASALGAGEPHQDTASGQGLVVFLRGDLGTGKTTFARALIQSLGFEGRVKSPTYGLLETYAAGGWQIIHLDLYRIEEPEEVEFLALADQFGEQTLLLVEWPSKAEAVLPAPDLELRFTHNEDRHTIECYTHSDSGIELANNVLRDFHHPGS